MQPHTPPPNEAGTRVSRVPRRRGVATQSVAAGVNRVRQKGGECRRGTATARALLLLLLPCCCHPSRRGWQAAETRTPGQPTREYESQREPAYALVTGHHRRPRRTYDPRVYAPCTYPPLHSGVVCGLGRTATARALEQRNARADLLPTYRSNKSRRRRECGPLDWRKSRTRLPTQA